MENKGNFRLVAGGHRFEAAKRLGLETIRCTVLEADDLRVELAEIDENLQRNDPGPAEHALLTGRRTEIIRQLALQNRTLSQTATASRQSQRRAGEETGSDPGSVRDHAIKTGETKDTVQRSKKRFETLGSAVLKKVVGTSLDKGAQLDALAQLPEAEREDLVNRASGGETVSARQVLRESKREAEEEPEPQSQMSALEDAFDDLGNWIWKYGDLLESVGLSKKGVADVFNALAGAVWPSEETVPPEPKSEPERKSKWWPVGR